MVSETHLVAVPGLLVAAACLAWAVMVQRRSDSPVDRPWLWLLLVSLGVFALLGWGVRPLLVDPASAFAVGVGLLVWETLLHGVLLGVTVGLGSPRTHWLRSALGSGVVGGSFLVLVVLVLSTPRAFIGHVGPLDGVPGLYRLAAGPAAIPWAVIMIGVRMTTLWVAMDAAGRAATPAHQRGLHVFVAGAALFLVLFLVWLSNPVVIHLTGHPYLPGPVRFALPLVWTFALAAAAAYLGTASEPSDGPAPDGDAVTPG